MGTLVFGNAGGRPAGRADYTPWALGSMRLSGGVRGDPLLESFPVRHHSLNLHKAHRYMRQLRIGRELLKALRARPGLGRAHKRRSRSHSGRSIAM